MTKSKDLVFYSWKPLSPETSTFSPYTHAQHHTRTSRTFCTFAVIKPLKYPFNMCLGSPITQISTPVEKLTRKAGSFCLCCFWQVVRHLWSLHVSGIHCHADLCSSSNIYPASWLILSVLFLTGGETSVVPTCVQNPPSHRSPTH